MLERKAGDPMVDARTRRQRQSLINRLDLNLLRVFDAMMAERNVNRAASRIGRTQSAVSHSLGKLRLLLDDDLFVRVRGRMEPTAIANELHSVVAPALSAIFVTLNNQLDFDPLKTTRVFTIGMTDYTAIGFLPLFTRRFVELAPGAKLNVLHTQPDRARSLIVSRELDCAVLGNFTLDHPDLRSYSLAEDLNLCALWASNDLLRNPLTADAYAAASHLQVSIDGISEGVADKALAAIGKSRKVVATIPHYVMAPWVIKDTNLLAILGSRVLLALNPGSETVMIHPPLTLPKVAISLIYNKQSDSDPGHTWLRRLILQVSNALNITMNDRLDQVKGPTDEHLT